MEKKINNGLMVFPEGVPMPESIPGKSCRSWRMGDLELSFYKRREGDYYLDLNLIDGSSKKCLGSIHVTKDSPIFHEPLEMTPFLIETALENPCVAVAAFHQLLVQIEKHLREVNKKEVAKNVHGWIQKIEKTFQKP